MKKLENLFEDTTLLLIGGTGSLGNGFMELMCQERFGDPRRVVVFSRDEAKQYYMRSKFTKLNPELMKKTHFRIGDIRDSSSLRKVLRKDMNVIINMAALKQIPPYEYLPEEAIKTNVEGVYNLVEAIRETRCHCNTMVQVSTDKACKPVNTYGMTKALAERIVTSANLYSESTNFFSVRYGNVLQSRGSMIPFFKECLESDQPIPLTDSRMTRFLMTMEDSCHLILRAIAANYRGIILVPELYSVRIVDVIDAMKKHYGKPDHPVEVVGIRPGEKIDEILISEEEIMRTKKLEEDFIIEPQFTEVPEEYGNSTRKISFGHMNHLQLCELNSEYSSASRLLSPEDCSKRLYDLGVLK